MFIDLINLQLNAVFSSLNICMQPTNRSTLFKKKSYHILLRVWISNNPHHRRIHIQRMCRCRISINACNNLFSPKASRLLSFISSPFTGISHFHWYIPKGHWCASNPRSNDRSDWRDMNWYSLHLKRADHWRILHLVWIVLWLFSLRTLVFLFV